MTDSEGVSYAPGLLLSYRIVSQLSRVEVMRLFPAWTAYIMLFVFCCFNTLHIITHYIIKGLFSAFVKFHLPVFTSSFSSAVTIETLHPFQLGAFGCWAHWLSQERDTGEQVFPWHDFGTNVVRKAFTWLWQCFLGSRHPTDSGTSTRFVTMGWGLRNVKSNWERSTPVIEMSSPGRQMLSGTCWLSTVQAYQPVCSR